MDKKVAIIGGGFTGLTAALRLAQRGVAVTVFEKEPELGGLVGGFKLEGAPLEKVYHFIYTSDRAIISLAEELGIKDKLTFYASSVATYYDGKNYPFMSPGDLLRFTPLSFLNRLRTGLVALYLQHVKKWQPLTQVTALSWMRKMAGEQATKIIWEPLLQGKFGKYYDQVAMSWLWGRIAIRANSRQAGETMEKLGYFRGGFAEFIRLMAASIEIKGGQIKVGVAIENITSNPDGTVAVKTVAGIEQYDRVIVTTPTNVFARLVEKDSHVTAEYLQQLKSIDYIGAVVMVFSSEQKISPYYWHNINDPKIPFLVFLSKTNLIGTDHFGGKHVYYIGTYVQHEHRYFTDSDEKIMGEWLAGLKAMFADFKLESVREKKLFRFKNAQHIVGLGYKEKIPAYASPLPGVYLANFSQIYPDDRGLNYAVLEGERIAKLVAENFQN